MTRNDPFVFNVRYGMRLVIIYNKVGWDEMNKFNRDKVVVLVVGVAAIYVIYSIMGVMQEAMYFMNYQVLRWHIRMISLVKWSTLIIQNHSCYSQP